ncbi:MAG: hypothetical protein WA056_01580 [Gallionella sp.]
MSTQPTTKAAAVNMECARLSFECLIEQEQDVFALLSAIRDRDGGADTTTTRLIELAWERLGQNEHQHVLGNYFGWKG